MGQPQGQSEHVLNSEHMLGSTYVIVMLGLSSDLMKFTVVNESLSIYKPNVLYWELFKYFNVLPAEWEIYRNNWGPVIGKKCQLYKEGK